MTQEQKDLLLKDLCARLPYGVKVESVFINPDTKEHKSCGIEVFNATSLLMIRDGLGEFKPYLFPMLSMTEEQKEELFFNYIHNDIYFDDFTDYFLAGELWHDICVSIDVLPALINWLDKNHIDYRGLIPKGLANDATGLNIY